MNDSLSGLSKGVRDVFCLRKDTLIQNTLSALYVPGMFIFVPLGGYLSHHYLDDGVRGLGFGFIADLSAMVATAVLGETIFAPLYLKRLKEKNAPLLDAYSEHLGHFVQSGTLPERCDQLVEDALRIDALPHHVQHSDIGALERTLAGISDDYTLIPGLFSSDRQDTPLLLAYQHLAELLSTSDIKPQIFISLFNPNEKIFRRDSYSRWVGGNRLTALYHEKKRYADEETFRALSRFKYNSHGPTSNS